MKKWEVFKDGSSLGLMTAKDIRQALREGAIDPFDMVCAEGSTIKSELVEVDEIFNEETNSGVQSAGVSKVSGPDIPSKIINLEQPNEESRRHFPEQAPLDEDSRMTASAMNRAIRAESKNIAKTSGGASDKKKAKKFFLIDEKKRVLGPVSATEIQSLFQRGIISTSVKVQKVDGKKMIPVRQFIANYSDKRIKALADQASATKQGNPSSKVLNELYQNMNSKKMAQKKFPMPLVVVGLVALLGIIGVFLANSGAFENKNKRRVVKQSAPEVPISNDRTSTPTVTETQSQSEPEIQETQIEPEVEDADKGKSRERSKIASPIPKTKSRPPAPKPTPKRTATPAASTPTPAATPTPTTPEPTTPEPTPPPKKEPKPRTVNTPKQGPIEKAMEKVGGVVTIGPLVYKDQDLEACALKCRLKFRDSKGDSLEAVFFKGAYYDILKNNSGGVTITGSSKVEGNVLVIFIQDVR